MPTSKLTNLDAQRILNIMDELKDKLSCLSVCTPHVLNGLQSEEGQATQELVGPELMKTFTEQAKLEELYSMANDAAQYEQREDGEDALCEEEKNLTKNTLELCRKMKERQRTVPNLVRELRNFQDQEHTRNIIQFLQTLRDMQDLTLSRLQTTVEEERSRNELLETYKTREADASKRRQQLERDLGLIRRECERAKGQRTQILTKLRADLDDLRESSQEKMNNLHNRYETRMKEHETAFKAREEELMKKIDVLREANKKAKAANENDESQQKQKANRHNKEVFDVIQDYDNRVKEMALQLGDKSDLYRQEQKHLQELSDHFKKVEEEKRTILAEEAIADARKLKKKAEADRRKHSAALVQAFWRGIVQRDVYASMKKASKKKGGKKKK